MAAAPVAAAAPGRASSAPAPPGAGLPRAAGGRRTRWIASAAAGWAALALLASPLGAVEPEPGSPAGWANLTGSISLDSFSSSRDLDGRDDLFGLGLGLEASPSLGPGASAVIDGWVRNSRLIEDGGTAWKLREGYLDLNTGSLELRAGTQMIIWGRADRINPTDTLTPRDFTLLVPDDDDQRFGRPAVRATVHPLEGLALTGIGITSFEPNELPFAGRPGAVVREVTPGTALRNVQWAAKLEQTGGAVDWSVSYFDGFDLNPDLGIGGIAAGPGGVPAVEVLLRHHRIAVVGADAAAPVGGFGLRGEVAYSMTQDPGGDDPETKNPFLFLVLGVERTFAEHLNVNVQYLFRAVRHFRDPETIADPLRRAVALEQAIIARELDRFEHGASLRLSYTWLNETLDAEIVGVYGVTREDYAIQPKLTYAITDRVKGTIGGDVFRGPERSFFGRIRDASTLFVELAYSF